MIGERYVVISPDLHPVRDRSRSSTPLQLITRQQPGLSDLTSQLAQTQKLVQQTFAHTALLTGRDMPQLLGDARNSLAQLDRLARSLEIQTNGLGPVLGSTLQQANRTAVQAEQASLQATELLKDSRPVLQQTLKELRDLAESSNRLLRSLARLGLGSSETH